jgi:hypothetical protein
VEATPAEWEMEGAREDLAQEDLAREDPAREGTVEGGAILEEGMTLEGVNDECEGGTVWEGGAEREDRMSRMDLRVRSAFQVPAQNEVRGATASVMVSPSPQLKEEENDKLHELQRYARDFRRQHTTDAERFNWDLDDEDYSLAIGRLVVT